MSLAAALRSLAARLLRPAAVEQDMDEEFRSHVQHRADDLERSGLPRAEAERRARIEFGGHLRFKDEGREAMGGAWLESLSQDIRLGLRMLRKSPSFTGVAVITLAITIGANAVVFAALNAFILRPLNVPAPESLYSLHRAKDHSANQSYPDYLDMRDRNRSFDGLAAFSFIQAGLETGGDPVRAWGIQVSGNYFDVLRIQPHLGRLFHASDERGPNSAPYLVLSHAYWRSRFQSDPGVVGRVVRVNKHPFTILGVAPPGFRGTLLFFAPDLFAPMVNQEQLDGTSNLEARGVRGIFMTVGHLKPGVTPQQAADDLGRISAELGKAHPQEHLLSTFKLARPSLYGDWLAGPMRAFLTALMLMAGLILLAACANLGSLFAARAADRSRELALRLALGAGRSRVLRQLFTEALLVALFGGVLGLLGSLALLRWLSTWQPFPQFPVYVPASPDASILVIALLLSVASGLLFGAIPVRQVLRADPNVILKSGVTGGVQRGITPRDLLLVAQIAICALLVTASMVAVRGLLRSTRGELGFEPRNTMLMSTVLQMAGYQGEALPVMQRRMIEAMQSIPGVTDVGLTDWVPLTNGDTPGKFVFKDEKTDLRPGEADTSATYARVSPGYLRAAGTALVAGRDLNWHDDPDAPLVALVNQAFARTMFGAPTEALGRYFKQSDGKRIQVVGIVTDGKYQNLTEAPKLAMFVPILQWPSPEVWLVVRSSEDPERLSAAMRGKLRELDPGLPSYIQTWTRALDLVMFPSRAAAITLGVLGVMAALLSITGIFGLAAYSVGRRLKELGIRMALGAQGPEVLKAALAKPVRLLAWGSVTGLALGVLASGVLGAIVYRATPRDPLVLTGVVLVMLLLGLLATWVPARRALSVDPLVLLREE